MDEDEQSAERLELLLSISPHKFMRKVTCGASRSFLEPTFETRLSLCETCDDRNLQHQRFSRPVPRHEHASSNRRGAWLRSATLSGSPGKRSPLLQSPDLPTSSISFISNCEVAAPSALAMEEEATYWDVGVA